MMTPIGDSDANDRGYTLIVVLVGMAFISSLSILMVQYAQWQAEVQSVETDLVKLKQAQDFASNWTGKYLEDTLPDSSFIPGTIERTWELPPDVTIQTRINSLNGQINLNRFKTADASNQFRKLVETLLDEMNYPSRVMRELARWIIDENKRPGLSSGRYGGYDYSAPQREILQLDEISLISGFKAIGLTEEFKNTFTIYGTGNINPLHFSPDTWRRFRDALDNSVPSLPQAALHNKETLRNYLKQDQAWEEISSELRFLSRKDDSFKVNYRLSLGGTVKRTEAIYVFDYEKKRVKVKTRYPVARSFDEETN